MTVFVTGGTGLVGRHVIEQLRARGTPVRALARSEAAAAALRAAGAEPAAGDLRDAASLQRAIAGAAAVVHAGAVILSRGDYAQYHATNVAPTIAVARAAAAAGARLVHISSVAVYGRRTVYERGAGTVSEDFGLDRPCFPGDHYARSKREAEQAVWAVARETALSAVALRPCVIYGEGDRTLSNRVARVLRLRVAPLVGGGGQPFGVVYAGNVAAAVLAALDRPAVTGAFNVANDGTLTPRQFLRAFAGGLGVRPALIPVPAWLAWGGANALDALTRLIAPRAPMSMVKSAVQFLASPNPYVSAKAERELGWQPLVAAEEAAHRTGRWFRDRAG